jgi:predicted PurR-regulated permease PerM
MTAPPAPDPSAARPSAPTLVAVAAVVVVLVGLHLAAWLIFLVALSGFATLLLTPVMEALERRGVAGWASLTLAMLVYLATIALVVILLVLGVAGFVAQLPAQEAPIEDGVAGIVGGREQATAIAEALVGLLGAIASALGEAAVQIGLSVFVVAYLLLERKRGAERLLWAFPGRPRILAWTSTTAGQLRSYLVARVLLGAIAAVLDTILLVVLGIPSALLWGVLSFLMSFVPNVGFFIALIPPSVLALGIGGVPLALTVAIGYVVINMTMDYAIQPRFIGSAVNLSAVVVTLSVFFWGIVLGPQGAMLAVPMTVIAANLADGWDASRPLARLLADIVPRADTGPAPATEPRGAPATEPAPH